MKKNYKFLLPIFLLFLFCKKSIVSQEILLFEKTPAKFEDFDGTKKRVVCILRSTNKFVRGEIAERAQEAYARWGRGEIDESDEVIATELYGYYKTANMSPPDPYLGDGEDA